MMYSSDEELVNLGYTTLMEEISDWNVYRELRGMSFSGKPFFPFKVDMNRKFKRLLKKKCVIGNEYKRNQIQENWNPIKERNKEAFLNAP